MKILYSLIFTLIFTFTTFAQTDLPIIGKISDIQGKKKVYLAAETTDSRKKIQKTLEKDKSFEIVGDPAQADFILEYKQLAKNIRQGIYSAGKNEDIGEMSAYFYNSEKKKVVAWSETKNAYEKTGWGGLKANETYLTTEFLKKIKE